MGTATDVIKLFEGKWDKLTTGKYAGFKIEGSGSGKIFFNDFLLGSYVFDKGAKAFLLSLDRMRGQQPFEEMSDVLDFLLMLVIVRDMKKGKKPVMTTKGIVFK
mgnify:CR=1 FL=1|jgi:hypothetical protein